MCQRGIENWSHFTNIESKYVENLNLTMLDHLNIPQKISTNEAKLYFDYKEKN
jgi:hypothetical protein